nr:Imm50 family immunity protein [uncultured Desulfobacter sp.]
MIWKHIDNSIAILNMYKNAPELKTVRIKEFNLSENGPTAIMKFDFNSLPDLPPKKWLREKYNAVHIELNFSGIENLTLKGWDTNNIASISIDKSFDSQKKVTIANDNFHISLLCIAISIDKISPYLNG